MNYEFTPVEIYYCFERATGLFCGSGTPFIDTDTHSCTTKPSPVYDSETEFCFWDGEAWNIESLPLPPTTEPITTPEGN